LENIKLRPIEWMLKFLIFNVSVVSAYYVLINFFGIKISSESFTFETMALILLVLGNVLFLVYDIAFTRLVSVYIKIWRKHVHKFLK
ncbi:MAG: hypothetical protein IKY44_04290, partial [Clostridia bacterium]|nr:hypothetical protein [Clostridia bacterium]